MTAGHLFTVAGTGVCGTSGQGGPVRAAQLWNPVAVALDGAGDLLVAESGDQSVLLAAATGRVLLRHRRRRGRHRGRRGRHGELRAVSRRRACRPTGPTAELNDPRGLAVGPTGALFVTDGFMHAIRVVPLVDRHPARPDDEGRRPLHGRRRPPRGHPGGGQRRHTLGAHPRWAHRSGVAVSPSGALLYTDAGARRGAGDLDGGRDSVSRFGRRTFLASSAGVAAGRRGRDAALPPRPAGGSEGASRAARRRGGAAAPVRSVRGRLTVNGLVDPVGVDPDDCSFAWTLQATGRGRGPGGLAHRAPAHRPRPQAGIVWDSGPVSSARQAFVAYGGPALAADAAYRWTVQAGGAGARWGPVSAPARFTTALRDGDWQAPVAAPGRQLATARPRHLPAHRGDPARRHRGPRHRLRLRRPHLPPLRGRGAGRRVAELLLSRRAVRARRGPDRRGDRRAAQRHRSAAPLVRAGTGPPRLRSRAALPALPLVRRRAPRRLRVGPDVARAPGRMAALAAAQLRRRRLRRVGGRASPAPGVVEPRLRRQRVVAGVRRRPGGDARRSPRTYAQRTTIRETAVASGAPAHRGGRRGRGGLRGRLRGAATRGLHPGRAGTDDHHAGRLPPRSRRPGLDSARDPGDQPLVLLHHAARAARPSRASPTSGSATSRSTTRSSRSAGATWWP